MRLSLFVVLAWLQLALPGLLSAQNPDPQRVSEREVDRQSRFIEAKREMLLGNNDKAAAILRELYVDDGENPDLSFALARNAAAMEAYDEAANYARRALELDPANPWYGEFLADTYQQLGLPGRAANIYEGLTEDYPDTESYYLKWALYLVRANEVEDAIKVYERLEKRLGTSIEIIRRKHTLYVGLGDYDAAAAELQRLVEAFPHETEYRHLLAAFYEEIDQPEQARMVYRQILEIDPYDSQAMLALAGNEAPDSDDMQYLQSLREVFGNPALEVDLKVKQLIPIVQRVAETGDVALADEALELTDLLDRLHPRSAQVHAAAADLLFHSGRLPEAIAQYEATLALDDTVFSVWEQLLNAYRMEGRYEALRDRSEEAMDYFPNKPIACYFYGLASKELEAYDDALYGFEQALLMSAADPQMNFLAQSQLGLVYHQLEQYDRSEAAFAGALDLQPGQPDVMRAFAMCLAERGVKLEQAAGLAREALDQRPQDPAFLDTYGWVLYRQQAYREAEKFLLQALEQGGDRQAGILEHYGDLSFQLGQQDRALEYWNRALQLGADSPLLEKKINDKQLYE